MPPGSRTVRRTEPLIGVSISLATARATASTALLAVVLTARTWLSEVAGGPSPRAAPGELGLPRGLLALLPGVQEHLVPCASGCAGQLGADGCSEAGKMVLRGGKKHPGVPGHSETSPAMVSDSPVSSSLSPIKMGK